MPADDVPGPASTAPGGRDATDVALQDLGDDELVERARRHDVAAFEALIDRHEEKVYRLAMRFVRNETDAAEILQEKKSR